MTKLVPPETIAAFRRFNRFYTKKIGVLSESLLDSPFSLIEARILFELASRSEAGEAIFASVLRAELGLDAGYLSRILSRFEKLGILSRSKSGSDGRRQALSLELKGWDYFRDLDAVSSEDAAQTLASLDAVDQASLSGAMSDIESLLGGAQGPSVTLRDPAPGDLGWVVSAHGELYSREYGYGPEFEALVARIVADFSANRDPERERAWIAARGDRRLGSIFLVKVDELTAKLRLLLLVPEARGLGLGRRLVSECLDFARAAGYRKASLWTNSALVAARSIYAKAGFSLVSSACDPMFADGSLAETWELEL
jgi:DNA-binding MarR family transcriptional regulator/GNAT superfamily N-acetyltransferase